MAVRIQRAGVDSRAGVAHSKKLESKEPEGTLRMRRLEITEEGAR